MNAVIVEQPSSTSKWLISLMSGLLFFLVSLPITFRFTQKIIGNPLGLTLADRFGPTTLGLVVHSIVFFLIVRLMMVN